MKTICLVMIVKNEALVIRRCLDSVKGIINHWVICDTGSTDGTREIIQENLKGIPGSLYQVPWVDFGHSRTVAMERARGKADYHLLIDADMTVNIRGEFREKLCEDAYLVRCEGNVDYYVPRLVSDSHQWQYIGLTHEYLHAETAKRMEKLFELSVTHFGDGDSRANRIQRNIAMLKQSLEKEPESPRNVFYMAQSYRDIGAFAQALDWYERRLSLGGWEEEVWYAKYQVARLQHQLGMAWPIVLPSYLAAYQMRPSRIEPLFYVVKYYAETGQYHLGYLFGRTAMEAPYPDDLLFIERNVYEFQLPLEYANCCSQIGKHKEAVGVNDRILAQPDAPEFVRETARKNREFSLNTLDAVPTAKNKKNGNGRQDESPMHQPGFTVTRNSTGS